MNQKRRRLGAGLALAAALVAVAGSAAADTKAFHGAACKLLTFSPTTEQSLSGYFGFMFVDNNETSICPLLRDETGSSTQITNAYVEVSNFNSNTMSCTMYTQPEDLDMGLDHVDFQTKSTIIIGNQQLGPFAPDTSNGNEGSYSFTCNGNQFDKIYHIYVNEN